MVTSHLVNVLERDAYRWIDIVLTTRQGTAYGKSPCVEVAEKTSARLYEFESPALLVKPAIIAHCPGKPRLKFMRNYPSCLKGA